VVNEASLTVMGRGAVMRGYFLSWQWNLIGDSAVAMRWRDRRPAPSTRRMTVAVWAGSRASCVKACLPSVLSEVDGVAGQSVEAFL